jgi:hypothetical protein
LDTAYFVSASGFKAHVSWKVQELSQGYQPLFLLTQYAADP